MGSETRRKIFIIIGMCISSFMDAFIFGHSASMVAALYAEKKELNLTDDTISWIMAVIFAPMIFGGLAATYCTERFGRRFTLTAFNTPVVIYWIILNYTRNGIVLILSRLLVGFCFGGTMPIVFMTITECSSPARRESNFAIMSAMVPLGGIVGQTLGLVFHWRTAALIAILPTVMTAIVPLFFVESPQWLASKGKFNECEEAFRALHGYKSEKELQLLIEVEKCKLDENETEVQVIRILMKRLKVAAKKRYFWNVMVLAYVLQLYKVICGVILSGTLGIVILKRVTGKSDVLKYTILTDSFSLLGCIAANFIVRKIKTRVIVFSGGILNNVILTIFSIIVYLKLNNDDVLAWVQTALLGFHLFVLNASIYPLLELIPQEIFPLDIKTVCTNIISLFSTFSFFVYIKVAPTFILHIDIYGVYMLSVLVMSLCLLFFWKKLPETKGRTLQEIELYFKNGRFVEIDDILKCDQIKNLV